MDGGLFQETQEIKMDALKTGLAPWPCSRDEIVK